jgi:protein tyrosine phosphatase (PTP) superfamily phosphohydrolase (DUF442 family)
MGCILFSTQATQHQEIIRQETNVALRWINQAPGWNARPRSRYRHAREKQGQSGRCIDGISMDTIYRGSLDTPAGRRRAWLDSLLVDHGVLRLGWTNAGAVVPGRLYRSNHPTPGRLTAMVRRWGIRTVINLRGQTGNGSDALSRERAAALGLDFIDVPFSSGHPPSRARVLLLVEALRTMREPGLVHCKSGADRAGFAAVVFLLLDGVPLARAMRHLSLRWGHFARSRAGVLDEFFRAYGREVEGHQPFLEWIRNDYDPDAIAAAHHAGGIASAFQDRILRRE